MKQIVNEQIDCPGIQLSLIMLRSEILMGFQTIVDICQDIQTRKAS